ncbi:MAG: hypothetical protein PHO37_10030 [Kiritimatiellae bacterium]|nr:hypothetical protein [Kiritimatiellia bacterium]
MANMLFKSEVKWTGESLQADARSGTHTIRIDEPEILGGMNTGPNPVELILSALGGCMVVLVNLFAPAHNVQVNAVAKQTVIRPDKQSS